MSEDEAYQSLLWELHASARYDGTLYLLLTPTGFAGRHDVMAMVLVGRCLSDEVRGIYMDGIGRVGSSLPHFSRTDPLPDATVLIQRAVRRARSAGVSFALCYHTIGDPNWRMAWSGDYDQEEAVRQMLEFVRSDLDVEDLETDFL